MTLTKKIAVTAAAATAIATGSYLALTDTDKGTEEVFVPKIPIAEIYKPTIPVAKVFVPVINKATAINTYPTSSLISYTTIYKPYITEKNIPTATEGIDKSVEFFKRFDKHFQDKSLTQYSKGAINRHNADIQTWLNIAETIKDYKQDFVPLQTGIKAIAEIHHPIDPVILNDNLEWYASKGYNAALITFGYIDENVTELCNVAKVLQSKNMKVLIAYSGPETHEHNVLISPDTLKYKITELSKVSDALILGWRRTSSHLYTQDRVFTNFIIKSARESNSNIAVIGEAFFGELNNKGLEKSFGIGYNIPNNSSAVLITGLGYNRIAVESVINNLLANIKDYNRLVLIGGDKPYYDTRLNTNKSFEYNFNIKEGLIKRWLKAGVGGAIVLHGDGSDGRYDEKITDNLAITKYN